VTVEEFIAKWENCSGHERANYASFLSDFAHLLGVDTPGPGGTSSLSVYQFEQVIPPTPVGPHIIGGTLNLPQSVLGRTGPDLPVVQHYANKRTVYVEPKTGVIVRGEEQQFSTYRDAAGTDVLTLTQANLAFNPATVKQQVETAKESRSSLRMIGTILPIAGALLGLLLTLLGVFLILSTAPAPRRARARRDEPVSV